MMVHIRHHTSTWLITLMILVRTTTPDIVVSRFDALKVINANKDSVKVLFLEAITTKIAGYSPDAPMGSSQVEEPSTETPSISNG